MIRWKVLWRKEKEVQFLLKQQVKNFEFLTVEFGLEKPKVSRIQLSINHAESKQKFSTKAEKSVADCLEIFSKISSS